MRNGDVRRRRALALTANHIERVSREVPDPGPSTRLSRISDSDREALADILLAQSADAPFWVFAYGSLIWNPAFEHEEVAPCVVHGWHRSFCLNMLGLRATPEQPGLMLALAGGGSCVGVAYRMPHDNPKERMLRLLKREVPFHEYIPWIRWLKTRVDGSSFRALTFYCAPPKDANYVRLPMTEPAARLALAVGPAGSCAEYLLNTVSHLESLGIRDRYLWMLQSMVAAEIDMLHGVSGSATT